MSSIFSLAAVTCLAFAAYLAVALVLDWWAPYIERRGRNNARFAQRLYDVKYGRCCRAGFYTELEQYWGASI